MKAEVDIQLRAHVNVNISVKVTTTVTRSLTRLFDTIHQLVTLVVGGGDEDE